MNKPISFLVLLGLLLLSGCATVPEDQSSQETADTGYEQAMKAAGSGEYEQALSGLDTIIESKASDQEKDRARVARAYVLYKQGDYEQADADALSFTEVGSNPGQLAYAYYLRGLIALDQGQSEYELLMGRMNPGENYPEGLRTAYSRFSELLTEYPESPYTDDAIEKAVAIRSKLAMFEIHSAKSKLIQGDYQEVLNRARYIDEYYTSPEVQMEAVKLMKKAYTALGEDARADQMEQRLQAIQSSFQ